MDKYLQILIITVSIVFMFVEVNAKGHDRKEKKVVSEMRMGLSVHDVGVFANSHEDGFDVNCDIYFVSPKNNFLEILNYPRPMIGAALHSEGQTHQFYGGLAWDFKDSEGVFLSLGVGGGVHTGELDSNDPDEQRLGSRVLFRFAVSAGYSITARWNACVFWDHMSNAHLADPNNGLDKIGLQVGYTF